MKKLLWIIGILCLINTVLIVIILITLFNRSVVTTDFGGTTHLGTLGLSDGLFIDEVERISGDGDFIFGGGAKTDTKVASGSDAAADFCDYDILKQNPYDYNSDSADENASRSFPTSATMIADCLPNTGDHRTLLIENTATESGRIIEFIYSDDYDILFLYTDSADVTGGFGTSRKASISFGGSAEIDAWNMNGTSVSYQIQLYASGSALD